MAKVRILVSAAGSLFSWQPGDVVEMNDEDALVWADGVRGELVAEEPPASTPAPMAFDAPAIARKRR